MKAMTGVLVLGVMLTALAVSGTASAETVTFVVQASGEHEVTPVVSGGAANAEFRFNDETNELVYSVRVFGLRDYEVTGAHLHRGAPGHNGPIAYTISDEGFVLATGSITLSDADVDALFAGEFYLNVHSVEYPDGFARGQLIPPGGVVEPSPAETSEVAGVVDIQPPATGDAGLADAGRGFGLLTAALLLVLGGTGTLLIRSRA